MSNRNWDRVRTADRVRRQGRTGADDRLNVLFPHHSSASKPARPAPPSKAELRAQAEAAFRQVPIRRV